MKIEGIQRNAATNEPAWSFTSSSSLSISALPSYSGVTYAAVMPPSMMSGMMSTDELAELGTLTGAAFDAAWAAAMIAHHEGAIEMAKTVLADGKNAETLALAQAIISGQELEIETLRSL